MKKFRFLHDGLAGDIYYPEGFGSPPKSAGLFLYGFPSFVGPNKVTDALVSAGILSFQPHYFGTYDSAGHHSPLTFMETCIVTQKIFDLGHVRKSSDQTEFQLPKKLEICVAHSFGCLIALRAIQELRSIKALILLAPAVHYSRINPDFGLKENGMEHLEYVRRANPFTYRLAPAIEWEEILTGSDSLPRLPQHPSLQEVIAIIGEKDKYFEIESLKNNFHQIVNSYCGEKTRCSFIILPGAGHPLDELVDPINGFNLSSFVNNYV